MFKIKDLLVSVLHSGGMPGGQHTSAIVAHIPPDDDPAQKSQFLAELKKQLHKTIEEMEHSPKPIREQLRPHTLESLDLLEREFTEAQHELKRLKEELSGQ